MATLSHRRSAVQVVSNSLLGPAASYRVTVLPVGGQANGASSSSPITVHAGHGVAAGDKIVVISGGALVANSFRAVSGTPGATSIAYSGGNIAISDGDYIVTLGPDGGTTTPSYDESTVLIYTDMAGDGAAITVPAKATVVTNTQGEYDYWVSVKTVWELIRNAAGAIVELDVDPFGVGGEVTVTLGNVVKFEGATNDAYETTLIVADPTADRTITLPNSTGTVALTSDLTPYMPLAGGTVTGNSTLGDASTDVFTFVGRAVVRLLAGDPTSGGGQAGTRGELARYNDILYIKTTGDGTDTNWAKVGGQ
jgi:hypothetical protein